MPTGYTSEILKGIDFKTFAMNCARAFGACITLRDERDGGEIIPEKFEPSDYHLKAVEKVKKELKELFFMKSEQLDSIAKNKWLKSEESRIKSLEEIDKQKKYYEKMLYQVNNWKPPTPEHQGIKDFMQKQILESINYDCDKSYYEKSNLYLTGSDYFKQEKERLQQSIEYHEKAHLEEVSRAEGRTKWIKDLRESL